MSVPLYDCVACPRLADFLAGSQARDPGFYAHPVPACGDPEGPVLVVGLAPGYRGANRTGLPFCGDASGRWLYRELHARGWASDPDPEACGGVLRGVALTNIVKCCPPRNLPTGEEVRTCRELWLRDEVERHPARVLIALGGVAHRALVDLAGARRAELPFAHGAEHRVVVGRPRVLIDCFHPSPQNTNTGRLTEAMFAAVFGRAAEVAAT